MGCCRLIRSTFPRISFHEAGSASADGAGEVMRGGVGAAGRAARHSVRPTTMVKRCVKNDVTDGIIPVQIISDKEQERLLLFFARGLEEEGTKKVKTLLEIWKTV